MGQCELCSCNHGKTNHRLTNASKITPFRKYNQCLFDLCQCEQYEYLKTIPSTKTNYQEEYTDLSKLI